MCVDAVVAVADLSRADVNLDLIKVRTTNSKMLPYYLPEFQKCRSPKFSCRSAVLACWAPVLLCTSVARLQ